MKVRGLLCVLAALLVAAGAAQPDTVRVRLVIPPPGKLTIENLWRVDLDNLIEETLQVWLVGVIEEKTAGIVYRGETHEFGLPPGRTSLRLEDLRIRKQTYQPGYEPFAVRTGNLPEGDYRYWVLVQPFRVGDTGTSVSIRPGKPRLILPRDGAAVMDEFPRFSWTRPVPAPVAAVGYRLRLVELRKGQTPEAAMKSNRPWFEKGGKATSISFPVSARMLEPGREYAWQVEVVSDCTLVAASTVARFRYRPDDAEACRCVIDDIRVAGEAVEVGAALSLPADRAPISVVFQATGDGDPCVPVGWYWTVSDFSDPDHVVGTGVGDSFLIPDLGAPRTYGVYLTVDCAEHGLLTRAFRLDVTSR